MDAYLSSADAELRLRQWLRDVARTWQALQKGAAWVLENKDV